MIYEVECPYCGKINLVNDYNEEGKDSERCEHCDQDFYWELFYTIKTRKINV